MCTTIYSFQTTMACNRNGTTIAIGWNVPIVVWLLLLIIPYTINAASICGSEPFLGCRPMGYTRNISIPGCPEFQLTSNICCGFCESHSGSTKPEDLLVHPNKGVTSVGQCCTMRSSQYIFRTVRCTNRTSNEMIRYSFASATSCHCSHCTIKH